MVPNSAKKLQADLFRKCNPDIFQGGQQVQKAGFGNNGAHIRQPNDAVPRRFCGRCFQGVKMSGLGMGDHRWSPGSIRPWVLACIELWGTDRAFFGTNWPVDRLYSSYCDVVEAYGQIIEDFTDAEIAALWSGTADRVFKLGGAADGSWR